MCEDEDISPAVRAIEVELERRDTARHAAGASSPPGTWPRGGRPTRRTVLGGVAAAVGAPVVLRGGPASAPAALVSGERAVVAAMHVHASFSHEEGSWQGQAWRMQQEAVDLLFMTDHSHGLMATRMAADLQGCVMASQTAGSLRQSHASVTAGQAWVLAESADGSPASASVITDPLAVRNSEALRTSVMGQVLQHTFGAVSADRHGLYEVRVGLSHHPATAGRPEGIYGLCFRFGPGLTGTTRLEDAGLTGVVVAPLPPAGTTVDLDLAATCAAAWPDLITEDNDVQWVSFAAVSPRAGVVVDVHADSVAFARAHRTPAAVAAVQLEMAGRYSTDYGLTIVPSVELGGHSAAGALNHHNAFTVDQYFAPDEGLSFTDPDAYTRTNVAAVHAAGGLVSWNHPYGASVGTPLEGAAARRRRQATYTSLAADDVFGVDILEVGYAVRGRMSIEDHLGLWDTFSRHARFLTGNGVSDSHDSAIDRRLNGNEFVTGIWSTSTGMRRIVPALAAGRAFTRHVTFWSDGQLDLLVDGLYRMGEVVIGSATSRHLTVTATSLPTGSVVEVVASPVDYAGIDPATVVVDTLPASLFGATGVATYDLPVPASCFVRLTVRSASGSVIGIGNPVWLLTAPPPGGVPPPRMG